jgi:trehalose/maltose hydrolase-like predicted phosphorylase
VTVSLVGGVVSGGTLTPLSQSLDMATGELTTLLDLAPKVPATWSVRLTVLQWMDRTIPTLAMQRIVATVAGSASPVNVTLQPNITTAGLPGTTYNDTTNPRNIFGGGVAYAIGIISNSGSKLGISVATVCGDDGAPAPPSRPLEAPSCSSSGGGMSSNVSVTMQSHIAYVSDQYHPDPVAAAVRQAHYGLFQTFDVLRANNRAVWNDTWRSRVVALGPGVRTQDQAALDAAVFYLTSSVHSGGVNGLPIGGHSCLEYGDRMFWDADTWMLPPLAALDNAAGAAVAGFRGRTVGMARKNAAMYEITIHFIDFIFLQSGVCLIVCH